ncbi:hypothetical protein C8F04DRAFT_1081094 [Mycena alexandri]|uniref:Uncharacterized protein n=1 Tax=Mycena alexandri TaxID=1745969 RepID=A0AAD6T8Q1_9AGAR|nr:hypothetical protein C8F04DRAFT_1081094 [Mycena alexandri]
MSGSAETLPPELERQIFELTAKLYPATAPTLLRVAQRVRLWIEPILYETLTIVLETPRGPHPAILQPFLSKPATFFQKNVRNLLLAVRLDKKNEQFDLILSSCSGVVNLALLGGPTCRSLLCFLAAMKLQRLAVCLQDLFFTSPIDLTLPCFAALTHLDLLHSTDSSKLTAEDFAALPALTHLHLYMCPALMNAVLLRCSGLKVLIHTQFPVSLARLNVPQRRKVQDPRLIFLGAYTHDLWTDWKTRIQGKMDLWAHADRFVQRRNGFIDDDTELWLNLEKETF